MDKKSHQYATKARQIEGELLRQFQDREDYAQIQVLVRGIADASRKSGMFEASERVNALVEFETHGDKL
jgi:hypothetical protein